MADHPALAAAADSGAPVVPLYVLDDHTPGRWRAGAASRWWLHGSLAALAADLAELGSPLVLRRGPAVDVIADLARTVRARAVYWNDSLEPHWRDAETDLTRALRDLGTTVRRFSPDLLFPPQHLQTRQGGRFKVFTPFWKACLTAPAPAQPLAAPRQLRACDTPASGDRLDDWALRPTRPDWAGGLRAAWQPGERPAQRRLAALCDGRLRGYRRNRDQPEPGGTSQLSPHLHFGEVSPRQVWHAIRLASTIDPTLETDAEAFLRQLGWREFCAHVQFDFPQLAEQPLQPRFAAFPWRDDDAARERWQRGQTGYPIVDAGMRQLWHSGWMHNRLRMIVASFLVKDLLIPWQAGEAWFWDTLVDADLGNNAGGWQWVAGCGTDAAPYFRVFNPVLQGEKFDPAGAYIRRWLPELRALDQRWIHRPWQAPPLELEAAGVRLSESYPYPIIDHALARDRALAAYAVLGKGL